jgi:GMP reductase
MRIKEDIKLDYKDVLICPRRSTLESRKDVELIREFTFKHSTKRLDAVPIVAANMDGIGTFQMADSFYHHKSLVALNKYYSLPDLKKFFKKVGPEKSKYIFYTIGLKEEEFEKLEVLSDSLKPEYLNNICIDVANGYTDRFVDFVKKVRERFPDKVIMAGNVVTPDMVEQLILAGADIVKVGIGSGSVCWTRKVAGVGYPQLSAVMECAAAAHKMGGYICADGGCEVVGDISKALAGGADFVMVGALLAGHKESGFKVLNKKGKSFIEYYGSSSETAMTKHYGSTATYRANEGKLVFVPYRGSVDLSMRDILGGLRSACTYVGAHQLKDLPKQTTFIRVNRQLNTLWHESNA